MSGEIVSRATGPVAQQIDVSTGEVSDLTALQAFALDLREAHLAAQSLCKTSFVPKQYRGKPEEAAAAMISGAEMGLSPMASLRAFDDIQGTPALRANALRAIVQAHGHDMWTEFESPERVVMCGQRKGSSHVEKSEWTIARAAKMGLTGKDSWKKMPQDMLVARATSSIARRIASDVLHGLYSSEELRDAETAPVVRHVIAPIDAPASEPVAAESDDDDGSLAYEGGE